MKADTYWFLKNVKQVYTSDEKPALLNTTIAMQSNAEWIEKDYL